MDFLLDALAGGGHRGGVGGVEEKPNQPPGEDEG